MELVLPICLFIMVAKEYSKRPNATLLVVGVYLFLRLFSGNQQDGVLFEPTVNLIKYLLRRKSKDVDSGSFTEPENKYVKRLYDEYMNTRVSLGQTVTGIDFESFCKNLKLNSLNWSLKSGEKEVRFEVKIVSGQATLSPIVANMVFLNKNNTKN